MNGKEARDYWQASLGNGPQPDSPGAAPDPPVSERDRAAGLSVAAESGKGRKKSILLVDSSAPTRESRAKAMRALGVRVVCAVDATTARMRLAAERYDLVLVDLGPDVETAEAFVSGIKANNARQLVGFLVGSPFFIAQSLRGGDVRRSSRPELPVVAPTPAGENRPAAGGIDFGQRIRDAEEKQQLT